MNRKVLVRRTLLFSSLFVASVARVVAQDIVQDTVRGAVQVELTDTLRPPLPVVVKQHKVAPPRRIRVNGYRVQVYYGGNDQKSKLQAKNMAERVKIWFEDLPVYTGFSSPHWICRVGDFQTREQAMEVLQTMKESRRFPEAIIVKSKINITEDELRREETDSCGGRDTTTCKTDSATVG